MEKEELKGLTELVKLGGGSPSELILSLKDKGIQLSRTEMKSIFEAAQIDIEDYLKHSTTKRKTNARSYA